MAEGQKININDKEYEVDSLTDEQRYLLNQIGSVDQKINGLRFDMDQLNAARQFFVNRLSASVEATDNNVADQLAE